MISNANLHQCKKIDVEKFDKRKLVMKTVMENITESDKEYRKLSYEVKVLIDEKRLHIKKYQESKR